MGKRLQRFLEILSTHISLWQALGLGGLLTGGALSAWFATASMWLDGYGPIGWWYAVLIGAVLGLLVGIAGALLRYVVILGGATRKWSETVDRINPLDPQYNRQRINLADLAHPVSRRISNKTFVDCDLIGPVNLLLMQNIHLTEMGFVDCDIVVAKPNTPIRNVIGVENITLLRGRIYRCVIVIPPVLVSTFQEMGATFITAIPNPEP
jgi:MFS family permease